MNDRDRRKSPRHENLAGSPVEAVVEDDGQFTPVSGAILVNHSEGGIQLIADMTSNLAVGKTLVVFPQIGSSQDRKRIETCIVWISESDGRIRMGCEMSYPLRGIPYYF